MVGTLKLAIEAAPRLEIACAVGRRESVRNVRVELIMTGITNNLGRSRNSVLNFRGGSE